MVSLNPHAAYCGQLKLRNWPPTGFKSEEPVEFDYNGEEESSRFNQLLMRALAEELISTSKAAALSNMKLAEFRDKNLRLV